MSAHSVIKICFIEITYLSTKSSHLHLTFAIDEQDAVKLMKFPYVVKTIDINARERVT